MNELQGRLERSQQVVIELEESTRRSGQRDGEVAELLRRTREASELELKRYVDEAEAKHQLDVSNQLSQIFEMYSMYSNGVIRLKIYYSKFITLKFIF